MNNDLALINISVWIGAMTLEECDEEITFWLRQGLRLGAPGEAE